MSHHSPYTDIKFVLSSSYDRGDFIGISGSGLDKAGIGVSTCYDGSSNFLSKSADTILNVYNGPYQYPSWQQVRNLYNPVVRKLVENSILSLMDETPVTLNSLGQDVTPKRGSVSCFKEPVVSENRPLVHAVVVQPNINEPTVTTSSFTYSYMNNRATFTNSVVRNKLGLKFSDCKNNLYDNISELYLDMSQVNSNANPVQKFMQLDYSQILYPSPINAYLNRTRTRTNYAEVEGTGSNGYDRIFGHQRTFFKEGEIRTLGTASNSQDYRGQGLLANLNYTSSFTTDGILPAGTWDIDGQTGIQDVGSTITPSGGDYCIVIGGDVISPIATVDTRFLQYKYPVENNTITSQVRVSFSVIKGYRSMWSGTPPPFLGAPISSTPLLIQHRPVTGGPWTNFTTDGELAYNESGLDSTGFNLDWSATTSITVPSYIRIAMVEPPTLVWLENNYGIQDLTVEAKDTVTDVDFLNFNPMATDGIRSFANSGSYRNYVGELMGDTDASLFTIVPQPSMAFLEQTHLANESGSLSIESDYVENLVEQLAEKNPWYDTYEKYNEDVGQLGKGMSLVPEFKMSDFMDYYINEKGGNFRARNNKFLSLVGGGMTSSANFETSSLSDTFVDRYAKSSKTTNLSTISRQHEDVGRISSIELKCKGIKKLLPYSGFYPANRTIQLGNLLSQSVGEYISGSRDGTGVSSSYYPQALQGLLKPLVSPGILYNSIKSGIAVDYPIYTGSVPGVVEGSGSIPSDFQLSSAPNYRLPFDALLNLKGAMPEGPDNPIRLVSSFAALESGLSTQELFRYTFTWDGKKSPLFELGMHNFLAETVDFFLESGELTSYSSKVQPKEGWMFDANKTYYMDVVLRDTVEMNKFPYYTGTKPFDTEQCFSGTYDDFSLTAPPLRDMSGSYFGKSVSLVAGSPGEGMFALVGAPYQYVVKPWMGINIAWPGAGAAYLFQNKLDDQGWQQIYVFTGSTDVYTSRTTFGYDVSLASGTTGLFALMGEPDMVNALEGRAHLYNIVSSSTGLSMANWQILTASDGDVDNRYGQSVSISTGSQGKLHRGIHCLIGAPQQEDEDGNAAGGQAYLYHSQSDVVFDIPASEHIIQASTKMAGQQWGTAVTISTASSGVYMGITAVGKNPAGVTVDNGFANLIHSTSVGGLIRQLLTSSGGGIDDQYGRSIDLFKGPDDVSVVVGADAAVPYTSLSNQGAVWLYHSKSSEHFNIPEDEVFITASIPTAGEYFGGDVAVTSGSDGVWVIAGAMHGAGTFGQTEVGAVYLNHWQSGSAFDAATNQQKVRRINQQGGYFGSGVSILSGTYAYALAGAQLGYLGTTQGVGYACLYQGSGPSMATKFTSKLSFPSTYYNYLQHGKLFGMALGNPLDPSYCAYTPPCFYGEAIARLSFTPTLNGTYTLDEIFRSIEVENILNLDSNRVGLDAGSSSVMTPLLENNKMPVSASVNMFGKFMKPSVSYDALGNALTIQQDSENPPSGYFQRGLRVRLSIPRTRAMMNFIAPTTLYLAIL